MAVCCQTKGARGRRQKPALMRLKLPALSCNGAGKLWAAGQETREAGGRRLHTNLSSTIAMDGPGPGTRLSDG
jgi:hypothetical protein